MNPTEYRKDRHGQRVARRKFRCVSCGRMLRFDRPEEHADCTAETLGRGRKAFGWLGRKFPMLPAKTQGRP